LSERDRAEARNEILAAEQDERRRIALFLHDGPVQSLAGIALMLDAAAGLIDQGRAEEAHEVLLKALERHRTTIGELRDLSFSLEPVVLRDQGLATALHALADQRGVEHGIRISVEVEAAERLGEQTGAALYEIVRESLEGAIRRGPPTTFSVTAVDTGRTVETTIVDDAPSERRRRSIEVLEERVRTLGATMSVAQTARGTTLVIDVPHYVGGG
jgi:two-component system sensor histidine kinase DegS